MSTTSLIIAVIAIGNVLFIIGFLIGSRKKRSGNHGYDRSRDRSLREDLDRVAGERDEVRERLATLTGNLIELRESESTKEIELERLRNEHGSQGRELSVIRSEHRELMTMTRELERANRDLMKASSIQEKALNETTNLLRTFMDQLQTLKGAQGIVENERSIGGDPQHQMRESTSLENIPGPPPGDSGERKLNRSDGAEDTGLAGDGPNPPNRREDAGYSGNGQYGSRAGVQDGQDGKDGSRVQFNGHTREHGNDD